MEIDGGAAFNGKDMFAFVDAMFAEDPEEYAKCPEKLLELVKERCVPHFKNSKSLNHDEHNAEHGDLVRLRCMVQDAKGAEMFLASAIVVQNATEEGENATDSERKACGLFRDVVPCTSLKEVISMQSRYIYTVVGVPGATEWYNDLCAQFGSGVSEITEKTSTITMESNGTPQQQHTVPSMANIFKAKFCCESAQDLLPNRVFDVYGILDTTLISKSMDDDNDSDSADFPRIHVIQYEAVDHHDVLAASLQEISAYERTLAVDEVRQSLTSLLGHQTCADYLICHLVSTTFTRAMEHPICSMPLNIINVSDSSGIIKMLKALVPKVQVLELTPSVLSTELFGPVMDHENDALKQTSLQLSDGTLLVIDETKLCSGVIKMEGNAEKNIEALKMLVTNQKVDYDYTYYQVSLPCDVNVLVLSSHPSVIVETPFQVALPPQFSDGIDPVSEMLRGDPVSISRRRHALLMTRKAVKDVEIGENINKIIEEHFLQTRENNSREAAGAQLHRLLTLCRLLGALFGKNEVDEACWDKAIKMEFNRLMAVAELLR